MFAALVRSRTAQMQVEGKTRRFLNVKKVATDNGNRQKSTRSTLLGSNAPRNRPYQEISNGTKQHSTAQGHGSRDHVQDLARPGHKARRIFKLISIRTASFMLIFNDYSYFHPYLGYHSYSYTDSNSYFHSDSGPYSYLCS